MHNSQRLCRWETCDKSCLDRTDESGKSMPKFSIAACCLSAALVACAAPAAAASRCTFLDNAPDAHRVRSGDTLWDIAARFLNKPWCWPAVWERNRELVSDPHRIYPGQLIVFDRQRQQLRLGQAAEGATRLLPRLRSEPLEPTPVPAIDPPWRRMAGELRLMPAQVSAGLPRILGFSDRRRIAGPGDIALVEGELPPAAGEGRLEILRMLAPVVDPDDGRVLGVPMQLAGEADYLQTEGLGLHTFRIIGAQRELIAGDRLARRAPADDAVAVWRQQVPQPAAPFSGKIASLLRGGHWAGQRDLVALNRGQRDGLAAGNLVSVIRQVRIAAHEANIPRVRSAPTDQAIATLLVLDAQDQWSLAFVLRSSDAIAVGDRVQSVEQDE